MTGGEHLTMILVRERVPGTFEIRVSTYNGASGALVEEGVANDVKGVSLSLAVDLVKIGHGEVYMISRGRARVRVEPSAGRAFVEVSEG